MGRLVHVEITAADTARARDFYSIFGWTFDTQDIPGLDYSMAHTGEGDIGIDCAIMSRSYRDQPSIHWVAVDDLDAMMEKVATSGGAVVGEKQVVPGIGTTVYCTDTEGNTFGMIRPLPRQ